MSRYDTAISGVTKYNVSRDTNINKPLKDTTETFGGNVLSSTEDEWNPAYRLRDGILSYSSIIETSTSTTAYIFSLQSRSTSFVAPTLQNGQRFRGYTAYPNTGACTINIANSGAVDIKKEDGTTDIEANDLNGYFQVKYDSANAVWILEKNYNIQNLIKLNFTSQATTISSGSIVYSGTDMVIDTESSASTDDLDTCTGGSEGDRLTIKITNDARNVVVKHGTSANQFRTRYGYDVNMDLTWESISFRHNGTLWEEVSRNIRQPSFSATISSQSVSTSTTTVLAFNTEEWDTTSDYDTGTYRFTPSVAGLYQVNLTCGFSISNTKISTLNIRKNGTSIKGSVSQINGANGGNSQCKSIIVEMNGTTDYINATAFHNEGSNEAVTSNGFDAILITN